MRRHKFIQTDYSCIEIEGCKDSHVEGCKDSHVRSPAITCRGHVKNVLTHERYFNAWPCAITCHGHVKDIPLFAVSAFGRCYPAIEDLWSISHIQTYRNPASSFDAGCKLEAGWKRKETCQGKCRTTHQPRQSQPIGGAHCLHQERVSSRSYVKAVPLHDVLQVIKRAVLFDRK